MSHDAQTNGCADTAAHDDTLIEIAGKLCQHGWAVTPNFTSADLVCGLRHDIDDLAQCEQLHPAAVGRGTSRQVHSHIRGDRIGWLNDDRASLSQHRYIARMRALQNALNHQLFLGLVEFECHFARYDPGAFYSKHLDQHADQDTRVVSAILYLNPHWKPQDGGQLRLYCDDESFIDVPPLAGTLVTFLSDRFFHEVLPTQTTRGSVTGWFRRRPLGRAL